MKVKHIRLIVVTSVGLLLAAASFSQTTKLHFGDDDAFIIYPGPDKGTPSPQGRCIGSGCSNSPTSGAAGSANQGGAASTDDKNFSPPSGGDTKFREGTFEVGPTNANGGYMGGLLSDYGSGGTNFMMSTLIRSQVQSALMLNPDLYFPRQQIMTDFAYVTGMREAMRLGRTITAIPQVAAPLPPTSQQLKDQINAAFERNFGPIRNGGRIKTNWDIWRSELHERTLPNMLDLAGKRDFPLVEAYVGALEQQVAVTQAFIKKQSQTSSSASAEKVIESSQSIDFFTSLVDVKNRLNQSKVGESPKRTPSLSRTEFFERQHVAEHRLATAIPASYQGGIAKSLATLALSDAAQLWYQGNEGEAAICQGIALALLDVSVSFTPFVGVGRDAYEFLTGASLLTGEPLSASQRVLAGASFATAGIVGSAAATFRVLSAFERRATDVLRATEAVRTIAHTPVPQISVFRHTLTMLGTKGTIKAVREAEEVNRSALGVAAKSNRRRFVPIAPQPPWNNSSLVTDIVLEAPLQNAVRLHGVQNRNGRWFALAEDIKGLNKSQIQEKFGLPAPPEFASPVVIPRGTLIRTGEVGPTAFGMHHGARQIEVPVGKIRSRWYSGPPVKL